MFRPFYYAAACLLALFFQAFSFSGIVLHDTIWSTDVIVTGNVTVDSTVTLTIEKGVKVQFVRLDNNADGNGDFVFTVNGKIRSHGTAAEPVVFNSYEGTPQRNDWYGLVFAGSGYCGSNITVKNAVRGIVLSSKCRNLILNQFQISSCISGLFADSSKDSTFIYNFKIDSTRHGAVINSATKIRMFNVRVIHSDSGGVLINQSTLTVQNSQFDTNGVFGLKLISSQPNSSFLNVSNTNFCKNKGYGIWVDSLSGLNADYCEVSGNSKTGILLSTNTLVSSQINYSNIFGNSISPDTINLVPLEYIIVQTKGRLDSIYWYRFPSYFSTIQLHCKKLGYSDNKIQVFDSKSNTLYLDSGQWGGTFLETTPWISSTVPLQNDSIAIALHTNYAFSLYGDPPQYVYLEHVTFAKPHQLIYLTKTLTTIDARYNYWGQISRIDTVIGTQSLVQWSNFETGLLTTAGYHPEALIPNIAVNPLSITFNNVPLNYPDSASVFVENTGENILVCQGISTDNGIFISNTLDSYLFGHQKDTIKVKFAPDSVKTETGYLNIPTNVTGKEIMQVVLQGTGVPANHAPTFNELMPDTLVIAGTNLNRSHPATDIDAGDSVTYSVVSGPTGLAYTSGIISWAIPLNAVNSTVIVKAVDKYGLTARDTFSLSINHPPQITSAVPDSNLTVGHAYSYDVNATDQDGDGLSYFLDSLVGSMIISQTSGLISFTPSINDTGLHTVKVRVTDSRGASSFQTYHISVQVAIGIIQSLTSRALPKSYSLSCHRTASGLFSLRFAIPVRNQSQDLASRNVSIVLYNLQGRLLLRAVDGAFSPGYYSIPIKSINAKIPMLLHMKSDQYSTTQMAF
jgi:hypothetical protein